MKSELRLLMLTLCAAFAAPWIPATYAQTTVPDAQQSPDAQPATPPAGQQPAPQSAQQYSEQDLKSFAVAALEVLRINDVYMPKLKMAGTPEEQRQVEKTAVDEMVKAVEKEGLTVSKYKEIMSHAEANPEVAERVMKHMKEAEASTAPGAGR